MFEAELMIGGIKAQSNRLKKLLDQMEHDGRWQQNSAYYAKEVREIEKCLRRIRKVDIESKIYGCGTS